MKNFFMYTLLVLFITSASYSFASDPDTKHNSWAALKLGTTGAGLEAGHRFSDDFGLRVNFSGFTSEAKETVNNDVQTTTVSIFNVTALVDWYVFSEEFKISAGLAYNDIKSEVSATGDFKLGNNEYYNASVYGRADWMPIAPYFGIGSGKKFGRGRFSFFYDLGFMYIGQADASVTTTGIPDSPQLRRDIKAEEDRISGKLTNIYPVVAIGFAIHF